MGGRGHVYSRRLTVNTGKGGGWCVLDGMCVVSEIVGGGSPTSSNGVTCVVRLSGVNRGVEKIEHPFATVVSALHLSLLNTGFEWRASWAEVLSLGRRGQQCRYLSSLVISEESPGNTTRT